MLLVDYSDTESETSENVDNPPVTRQPQSLIGYNDDRTSNLPRKRKAKDNLDLTSETIANKPLPPPPLPSAFHSLYATNVRTSTSDDPALHGGRKRQIVHVEGNWPSHIYLEWLPDKVQLKRLDDIIQRAQDVIQCNNSSSSNSGDMGAPSSGIRSAQATNSEPERSILIPFIRTQLSTPVPLHISLSAPLVLTTLTKNAFHDTLVAAVLRTGVGPITVTPSSFDLVPNFEASRWFLIMRLKEGMDNEDEQSGKGKLDQLLKVCNDVCVKFGLPGLYTGCDDQRGIGVEVRRDSNAKDQKQRRDPPRAEAAEEKRAGRTTDGQGASGGGDDGDVANAFHISVAWTLKELTPKTANTLRQTEIGVLSQETIVFDRVKVKIGNVVNDILL